MISAGHLRTNSSAISVVQRLIDGALIVFVYAVVLYGFGAVWDAKQILVVVLGGAFFMLVAEARGIYCSWRVTRLRYEIREVIYAWLMAVSMLLFLAFLTETLMTFSRVLILSWFTTVPVVLTLVRFLSRVLLREMRRRGLNSKVVAIVGHNEVGLNLAKRLEGLPWAGLRIRCFFDSRQSKNLEERLGTSKYEVRPVQELIEMARAGDIDCVYIALPMQSGRRVEDMIDQLADSTVSVYVVPDLFISGLMHSRWVNHGDMPLVGIHEEPFYGVDGWLKRAEDIVLASLILLLIAIPMMVIGVAVKATSPGPALFKQRRYGLHGAVVEVWKFRSMSVCEDGDDIPQAKRGDARVTKLGAFLRKTSLDELPQFINVLQGSMSVVGPRPHAVVHNEQYRSLIRGYMLRHKVKPGITGWAQVNGWRGETDSVEKMRKRVECDLEYIQRWSLWFDSKIVFLTVFRGFLGKDVY